MFVEILLVISDFLFLLVGLYVGIHYGWNLRSDVKDNDEVQLEVKKYTDDETGGRVGGIKKLPPLERKKRLEDSIEKETEEVMEETLDKLYGQFHKI